MKKFLNFILILILLMSFGCNMEKGEETLVNNNPEKTIFDVYDVFEDVDVETPERSTFFSTVTVEDISSIDLASDGDLWAQCWSDDNNIYAANGDGSGFGGAWSDVALNRITGSPYDYNLNGSRIGASNLSKVWASSGYNRKPTSMLSVDGILYMAVQDLNNTDGPNIFNDAPNATIIKSVDKGKNWTFNEERPMFSNHIFTTVMFLDYGQDSKDNTFDEYVYAYGLDYNWRDSFSGSVADPQSLYLARMKKEDIMSVSKWEFYTGDLEGNASWSEAGDINSKQPVLKDKRRVYNDLIGGGSPNYSVLSQGSIVYNKAINRYIYTSWTEYTYEFYESPTPYGPWKHFFSKDFGKYKWDQNRFGGYATVIPSKFISEDGLTMYVCSCTFTGGIRKYNYSLRKLVVSVKEETTANNQKSNNNLANPKYSYKPTAISRATHFGLGNKLNDGDFTLYDSSYNFCKKLKNNDFWGYEFGQVYNFNELVYTVGEVDDNGGWFLKCKVQVRVNGKWVDVSGLNISDNYTFDSTLKSFDKITMRFNKIAGDGIRIIGIPGGVESKTTIAELEVYYK